jgi:hypothetical protein
LTRHARRRERPDDPDAVDVAGNEPAVGAGREDARVGQLADAVRRDIGPRRQLLPAQPAAFGEA